MLNWWIKSGYKLEYTNKGIDIASARGLIHILNWWKNSGLELKYSEKAINDASINDSYDVLKWWKTSTLELKYDVNKITTELYINGNLNMLQWFNLNFIST